MPSFKEAFRLYGKPNERMILIALCKKCDCDFKYKDDSGIAIITGSGDNVTEVTKAYNAIIAIAYKKLAMAQGSTKLASVNVRTLNTQFMQGFSAMAYSLITGEPFLFKAETEAQRAGLKAGGLVG